ncbi:MAG: hypothetical protein PWQ39_191 [Thermacetogenium sp.]|nr:hypothetical protein [Thermacetogenium sp.]
MRKFLLFLIAAVLLVVVAPFAAVAASVDDIVASNPSSNPYGAANAAGANAQDGSAKEENMQKSDLDISMGLPKVTEQDAVDKAARITGKIHSLASKVIPGVTLVVLVMCAVLGIFWGAARRMVLFAIIALAVVLWAPFLISLAVSLLNA